jgi:Zn finger protein HypA/HybF involved in hydrogenase expression
MSAHAGESAQEGGEFRCANCHERVRVNKGQKIPACPNCGGEVFDSRQNETSGRAAR